MPDVSLVLALHREGHNLARTLRSLAEAACFAAVCGISTELVAVLDRPDPITESALRNCDLSAFMSVRITSVDNGSLGPTRNDGCRLAEGAYILTADGDDLISFNTIERMFRHAERLGPQAVLVPEFIFAFGAAYHIAEYFDLDQVTPLSLLADNPFTSRVFFHHSLLERLTYSDVRITQGYAYEDWHFNCNAVALGYTFHATAETILFYRKSSDGLLQQGNQISIRQIPSSMLFSPERYRQVCGPWADRIAAGADPRAMAAGKGNSVLRDPVYLELLLAAHAIDPAISPDRFETATCFNYLGADLTAAIGYHRLCTIVGDRQFDEVFLLPFLTTGGADRYVLNVIHALVAHDPARRILILLGERFARHTWLERLPPNCVHIDLFTVCAELDPAQHDLICLKLIQSCAANARLHLRSSEFGQRFFARFGPVLGAYRPVFYRFSDGRNTYGDMTLVEPSGFHFVSENIETLDRIVCDNARILADDQARLRFMPTKWHVLYSMMELPGRLEERSPTGRPGFSLLWVSRLDAEKRLELLMAVARRLRAQLPTASIHVYGQPTLNDFDVARFASETNVRYHGAFESIADLRASGYDGFLYTSSFDGIPTVLLEMIAAGLPVIAPDVGAIGDLIRDRETGLLITTTGDDEEDAARYVHAIASLAADSALADRIRRQAFALAQERHAPEQFKLGVAKVFGLTSAVPQLAAAQ